MPVLGYWTFGFAPFEQVRPRQHLARPDVRAVRVPVFPDRANGTSFSLAYADAGARDAGPTLVVLPRGPGLASLHGGRDARTPVSAVQALAERLPDAGLIEFPQAGHDLLSMRGAAVTAIAAALARGGLQQALATGERVRQHRPRGRLLELYERRLTRRAANA